MANAKLFSEEGSWPYEPLHIYSIDDAATPILHDLGKDIYETLSKQSFLRAVRDKDVTGMGFLPLFLRRVL